MCYKSKEMTIPSSNWLLLLLPGSRREGIEILGSKGFVAVSIFKAGVYPLPTAPLLTLLQG